MTVAAHGMSQIGHSDFVVEMTMELAGADVTDERNAPATPQRVDGTAQLVWRRLLSVNLLSSELFTFTTRECMILALLRIPDGGAFCCANRRTSCLN